MNGVAVLKLALESVSRELERELDGLTANHLVYRPTDEANTIGFTAWHIIRMLDGAATSVVPRNDDALLIWERDGWYERFGMEAKDSGTGFDGEQVGAFSPDLETLLSYSRAVGAEMPAAFDGLTDEDLDVIPNPEQPNMSFGRRLLVFFASHTQYHLGEIRYLKGLQGMPFPR